MRNHLGFIKRPPSAAAYRMLISEQESFTAKLYRTDTWAVEKSFTDVGSVSVTGSDIAPDGKSVVFALGYDIGFVTYRTTDFSTWTRDAGNTFPSGTKFMQAARFHPDGTKFLVIGNQTPYAWYFNNSSGNSSATGPSDMEFIALDAAFYDSGAQVAIGGYVLGKYFYKYTVSGWTKYGPTTQPSMNAGYGVAVSPDKSRIVYTGASPYIFIYDTSNWSQVTNPTTPPTGNTFGASFSPDGRYCAFAHTTSPYVSIYDVSTSPWTKLSNPSTLPTGDGYVCKFSPDSKLLAVGHSVSPYITIYNTSDWSKVANPSTLPTNYPSDISFALI